MVYRKIKGKDAEKESRNKEIREQYATGRYTYRALGGLHGISHARIGQILKAH